MLITNGRYSQYKNYVSNITDVISVKLVYVIYILGLNTLIFKCCIEIKKKFLLRDGI